MKHLILNPTCIDCPVRLANYYEYVARAIDARVVLFDDVQRTVFRSMASSFKIPEDVFYAVLFGKDAQSQVKVSGRRSGRVEAGPVSIAVGSGRSGEYTVEVNRHALLELYRNSLRLALRRASRTRWWGSRKILVYVGSSMPVTKSMLSVMADESLPYVSVLVEEKAIKWSGVSSDVAKSYGYRMPDGMLVSRILASIGLENVSVALPLDKQIDLAVLIPKALACKRYRCTSMDASGWNINASIPDSLKYQLHTAQN